MRKVCHSAQLMLPSFYNSALYTAVDIIGKIKWIKNMDRTITMHPTQHIFKAPLCQLFSQALININFFHTLLLCNQAVTKDIDTKLYKKYAHALLLWALHTVSFEVFPSLSEYEFATFYFDEKFVKLQCVIIPDFFCQIAMFI